jgi:hypothetical protein
MAKALHANVSPHSRLRGGIGRSSNGGPLPCNSANRELSRQIQASRFASFFTGQVEAERWCFYE